MLQDRLPRVIEFEWGRRAWKSHERARVPRDTETQNTVRQLRLGSVATKVARDWLANELYEPSRRGKIDAACTLQAGLRAHSVLI